jgi:hypothetical protein
MRTYIDILMESAGEREYFIRFGDVPESGFSTIHSMGKSTGKQEVGVSAYSAFEENGRWFVDDEELNHTFTLGHLMKEGRDIYLLTGRRLPEKGSDGEPLIADVEIVKKLPKVFQGTMIDFL